MSDLTIRMMVRLGPWMFLGVDDKSFDQTKWENCEIEDCGEHIRYVHVLKRNDDPREWRIGSTCGPKLEDISEAMWGRATKDAALYVKLLHRAERIKELEAGPDAQLVGQLGPNWVDPMIALLKSGELSRKTLPFKNYSVTNDLQVIKLRIGRAERTHKLKGINLGRGK